MVNAGGAEGAINAGDILKPYLARGDIRVIGATTTREYEKFIAKDKALERRFEVIKVDEPTLEETKEILNGLKESYEQHHNIKITDENIDDIVNLSNKYLFSRKNPDKTIDLLDSVCAYVKRKSMIIKTDKKSINELKSLKKEKEEYVKKGLFDAALDICEKISNLENKDKESKLSNDLINKKDILKVIENKSNIPMFLDKEEILNKIQQTLHENIYYEEDAKEKIINNLKIYLKKDRNLKLLLLGPSGVGKTSSVKLISKALKNNLIRLDMSEYNLETSVNKLFGVSHGYV